MRDPITDFERVRDFYITYLETAFRIADPETQARRRRLLEQVRPDPTLTTEPLLEPVPRYRTEGVRIDHLTESEPGGQWLPRFGAEARRAFVELALAGLLPSEDDPTGPGGSRGAYELYTHQLEMLGRGVDGEPGIVTSGTGSGKTEAFLLPVLAAISQEALDWPDSPGLNPAPAWWRDPSTGTTRSEEQFEVVAGDSPETIFEPRRSNESPGRPKAVRALILYPMNALVEDQMVRLRKALDSERAHRVMDRRFGGNRIFFSRYTSATPVTGFLNHPREPEESRRKSKRKLMDLFREITLAERTRREAVVQGECTHDPDLPYNFPRVGGSELFSRWDIQQTPPDILITNTTMLSALLVREIDEPIWQATKDWLQKNDDSYFYLVLDELHLQRGTAGTEVAFLLRLLVHRLGLHAPEHRHKLRILASSASLPMQGAERDASLDYLWDMFGRNGLMDPKGDREDWSDSVITGYAVTHEIGIDLPIEARSVHEAVLACEDGENFGKPSPKTSEWRHLAEILGVEGSGFGQADLVRATIRGAADILVTGCTSNGDETRATPVSEMARRIFGDDGAACVDALRALLRLRSAATSLDDWFPDDKEENRNLGATSFRTHLFARAIEGLFSAPRGLDPAMDKRARRDALFEKLSVERGQRYWEWDEGSRSRFLELLYCECCGELFFGGMTGRSGRDTVELLPSDPDPEGLPEHSKPQLFEQLTAEDFAVFWPTSHRYPPWGDEEPNGDHAQGIWRFAQLDPQTGRARLLSPHGKWSTGMIPGFLYDTDNWTTRRMARDQAGSHVPFQCPFCGESYHLRRTRTSPIRNFRVGFGKSTQLLASELMARLRGYASSPDSVKLVSFADSRQDAAKAALDLETRHHEDVRREFLVRALERASQEKSPPEEIGKLIDQIAKETEEAGAAKDWARVARLEAEKERLKRQLEKSKAPSIPLADILDVQGSRSMGDELRPVTAALVEAGVHPTDPSGIAPVRAPAFDREFSWQQLFDQRHGSWLWADDPSLREALAQAQSRVRAELQRLATETIFHRSYFSLEESGWAYACLEPVRGQNPPTELATYQALVRVLADMWRYRPRREEWDSPKRWLRGVDASGACKRYAIALWGEDWSEQLNRFLEFLRECGHDAGILQAENLRLLPVAAGAPFWRCGNCGRVHLHLGGGICTRCLHPLNEAPTGEARHLRQGNYLSRRVEDPSPTTRLRAEELTAMTSAPGARLRRFKGILIEDRDDILPTGEDIEVDAELDRAARVVDVLSVTTTMEVGVDIGSLEAVFQANMPPQRFNYQQRVGRAGRRGRPFSVVLTVCRSKSHDLHYFRNSKAITGEPPPPPFLTSDLVVIARRLVRKAWLWHVFRELRESWQDKGAGRDWPADAMKRPDIHGEFMTVEEFHRLRNDFVPNLRAELEASTDFRDEVAAWFSKDAPMGRDELLREMEVDDILDQLGSLAPDEFVGRGLGEGLAEQGWFPMYGMPTRVRVLYTGPEPSMDIDEWEPVAVDRDLEIAVQEFAPGEHLVKDKRRHQSIGYTGTLAPRYRRRGSGLFANPLGDAFGNRFHLVQCDSCRGWRRLASGSEETTTCGCGAVLETERSRECIVPNAFRTSYFPLEKEGDFDPGGRQRSAIAETASLKTRAVEAANVEFSLLRKAMILRLNRGRWQDSRWTGFTAIQGTTIQNGRLISTEQWLDERFLQQPKIGFKAKGGKKEGFFLAAPKVTNSLVIIPERVPRGLRLDLELDETIGSWGRRAALISATFLLVYKAARRLDVDPDEFEIIEPRTFHEDGRSARSLIQFCDALVNGSGLCDWLGRRDSGEEPAFVELVRSIVSDDSTYPLTDIYTDEHRTTCDQSCYVCLNRFGNQPYHGLLDWRLGLDVLELFLDPSFDAGLGGTFETRGLRDWPRLAAGYASEVAEIAGTRRVDAAGHVPLACLDSDRDLWASLVHPLWDWNVAVVETEPLMDFASAHNVLPVSTFDIARRPVATVERLRRNAG